jgi:hypothetical protein
MRPWLPTRVIDPMLTASVLASVLAAVLVELRHRRFLALAEVQPTRHLAGGRSS